VSAAAIGAAACNGLASSKILLKSSTDITLKKLMADGFKINLLAG
jgi:hypothetical protein